jgi:hypothetical protein
MNAIREQFNRPIVIGVVAFIVGLLIGWLAIGWGIWPVEYQGAYPRDLVYVEKVNYLRTVVEAYGKTGDKETALQRFNALGADGKKALNEVINKPAGLAPELLTDFSLAITGESAVVQPQPGETQVAPEPTKEPTTTKKSGGSLLTKLWPVLCLVALVVAGVLVYFFLLRGRGFARTGVKSPAMEAAEARKQVAWTDYTTTGGEPPVAQFMASYKLGDDLFDDSFSIDSPAGEFLGECGVGISETVGVGEPKKVTAFEVWLFDKNDIQTVTKVVMSANAFNDPAIRQRLEAKGEPVLAAPGAETVLETQTLTMTARVAGANYGAGAMPDESYFDSFILELAVWQK